MLKIHSLLNEMSPVSQVPLALRSIQPLARKTFVMFCCTGLPLLRAKLKSMLPVSHVSVPSMSQPRHVESKVHITSTSAWPPGVPSAVAYTSKQTSGSKLVADSGSHGTSSVAPLLSVPFASRTSTYYHTGDRRC